MNVSRKNKINASWNQQRLKLLAHQFCFHPMILTSYWDSSGVYICKSIVNYLRHGNFICKSEENVPDIRTSYWDSSGVYTCKSVVNDLRHGNYICKSEGIYLVTYNHLSHTQYVVVHLRDYSFGQCLWLEVVQLICTLLAAFPLRSLIHILCSLVSPARR